MHLRICLPSLLLVLASVACRSTDSVQNSKVASTPRAEPAAIANQESPPSALARAAISGDAAEIEALVNKGANPNEKSESGVTPLMLAAGMGRIQIVNTLLAKGAGVNAKSPGGSTPQRAAA